MTTAHDVLIATLVERLHETMAGAPLGHCVRVDDVEQRLANDLAERLQGSMPHVGVYVLRSHPQGPQEIRAERAIEIRNRKTQACLLLVPAGEGHAASSLDNSFHRISILAIYEQAESAILERITDPQLREQVRRNRRWLRGKHAESWTEFLAQLQFDPTSRNFGANLWRVGLIPDLGDSPESRLDINRHAARCISQPSRPAASIDERLSSAGVQDGPWRAGLRRFLEQQGARLANPRHWCQEILTRHPHLTFDNWLLAEVVRDEIESITVEPFIKADGTLDKTSKLELGSDQQLILRVPAEGSAPIVVKWHTIPRRVATVAKWQLNVLPPEDERTEETEPLATALIGGDKERGTVRVAIDEDALLHGTRFVVNVKAVGEHGEAISLTNGDPAEIDSQEFQVVAGAEVEARARRTASPSIPEAVMRAALDGLDDLSEDLVSWDLDGGVFGLRLGNRRAIQVRVSESLIRLQRHAISEAPTAHRYAAEGMYGVPLDAPEPTTVKLPGALRRNRADVLALLRDAAPRDTAESAHWSPELRAAARTYLSSYRRAIDAAEGEALSDLLTFDTLSLNIRRNNETVRAVVVLPIHPLRLAWICEHDEVLRSWADSLTEVNPRGARPSMVDAALAAQIVPANLPFALVHADNELALYTEELTFGAGLYLVPSGIDSDAAAESVCSVLGLERADAAMRASSRATGERIDAYIAAHAPGDVLRVLSVNPGSGELLSGALEAIGISSDDDEVEDHQRLEVIGYTDHAAYVRPVPALADLQARARLNAVTASKNHLMPPLSVSIRPVDELLDDPSKVHLAIIQDVGPLTLGFGSAAERHPSFRDLLTPLVTRPLSVDGDLVWESVPATGQSSPGDHDLAIGHRSHQRGLARLLTQAGKPASREQVPVAQVTLDGESQARISTLHQRADWVIGIDRFVGVDLYEGNSETAPTRTYILDYAPDFVEGIGDRLTVTTANRDEVERLLNSAMRDLGLADVDHSVGSVLATLAIVSGRLALRLLENNSLAREAVSLAAVISHLRARGALDDTIVVPVDAHPEIFGAAVRGEGSARRCDLLLVRLGPRSFKIECVEVKSRKEAKLPQALADLIVNQVEDTRRVLESRFFAADPPRIDGELQRARLASLLHYYADRSAMNGMVSRDRLGDLHRYIDRIEESAEPAQISMRGFVISLDGDQGFKKQYGQVSLTVLTSADLGQVGFTTIARPEREPQEASTEDRTDDLHHDAIASDTVVGGPTAAGDHATQLVPVDLSTGSDGPQSSAVDPNAAQEGAGETSETSTQQQSASWTNLGYAAEKTSGTLDGEETHHQADSFNDNPSDTPTDNPSDNSQENTSTDDVDGSSHPETSAHADPLPDPDADELRPGTARVVLGQDAGGAPVTWEVSTQGSPHAFVVGIPGQGKSVTTRKIIRDFATCGLPSLVFDFHGDMASNPPAGATVLNAAEGLPFNPFEPDVRTGRPINTTAWEIAEVIGYVAKLGEIQRNHVYRALQSAYAARGWTGTTAGDSLPTMEEFANSLEAVETGAQGRNARARLQPFTDFGLFADDASGRLEILNDERRGMVIDVSQLGLEEVQRFAASFMLRRVYREMFTWPQDATMKLCVVLDEAHRMAKDVTLPKIMKEGRKYGVGVVVASQSADDFHTDVLGNAGTKIVFRTNFPASKGVSGFLRGRSGLDLSQEIEKLDVGVAFVSTPDIIRARRAYMAQ